MVKLRRFHLIAAGAGLAALLMVLLASPLRAEDADTAQGWTVWYGGDTTVYAAKDGWQGTVNPSGITLRNSQTGVERHYFGTFRAEMRPRDQR
jgi:hypothetical protein